ncbi:hypothetical protein DM860_002339 [Cuscuta australis]|uniref:Uncharacterized protein n=1 Tax=Cuscuta australis TaxID=267555 RepID=A0A328D1Q0_9ASTE|nr:hypothetical protein DM860_002339 [Cuscuta australis]
MGRAPCCEKTGLKRGPWTPDEDRILVSYIHSHGHSNWRALPKLAGLLRCGKSCRLRWTNYLRPDIKRGNFTKEEEDNIIHLHQILGNRWSAIAAKLPGRTDNEIKNVWHTHLKKRLKDHNNPNHEVPARHRTKKPKPEEDPTRSPTTTKTQDDDVTVSAAAPPPPPSPPGSSASEMSGLTEEAIIDDSFWTENVPEDFPWTGMADEWGAHFDSLDDNLENCTEIVDAVCRSTAEDDLDFWYDVFIRAGDVSELPQF